jgi:crotonobetainyl-CoA:carnitine CoA-transferase CaiB-like acyl-CoA transferase
MEVNLLEPTGELLSRLTWLADWSGGMLGGVVILVAGLQGKQHKSGTEVDRSPDLVNAGRGAWGDDTEEGAKARALWEEEQKQLDRSW